MTWPFSREDEEPLFPPWVRMAALLAISALLAFFNWYRTPDQLARRLCAASYRQATTAADTAMLDPLKTMGRDGVVARYTCGELRLAGRLD